MKTQTAFILAAAITAAVPAAILGAKTLWQEGSSVYRMTVKTGDIVRIRFTEKTILKYKIEQKQSQHQLTRGRQGGGELFSFFPDAEVSENDTIRNQNAVTVNSENRFVIPAKVTRVDGPVVSVSGVNSSVLNGENFKIAFSGEFDVSSLLSDRSVLSTDVFNLDFRVTQEPPVNEAVFSEDDLVFRTNYTELTTNATVTGGVTNWTVATNMSSIRLELAGIRDSKKKQILANYLNSVIQSLFH